MLNQIQNASNDNLGELWDQTIGFNWTHLLNDHFAGSVSLAKVIKNYHLNEFTANNFLNMRGVMYPYLAVLRVFKLVSLYYK